MLVTGFHLRCGGRCHRSVDSTGGPTLSPRRPGPPTRTVRPRPTPAPTDAIRHTGGPSLRPPAHVVAPGWTPGPRRSPRVKRPTARDVAQLAGVSRAAVSFVFSGR